MKTEIPDCHPGYGRPSRRVPARFLRRQDGVAAIEFAIFGGLLAMMLVVAGDLGMGYYSKMTVQTAAQVGAQYAVNHGFNAAAIRTAVLSATSTSGISASPDPVQFCGCPSTSTLSTVTCSTVCADGSSAGTYVRVSASRTYATIIPYPWLAANYAQQAVSTVRIK